MNFPKYLFFILLSVLFINSSSRAQLKIFLGPAIGLTTPTTDYSGETTDYYEGTKYGLRSAVNFGAMGKLSLGPVNFNLSAIFSPLSNEGRSEIDKPNSSVEIEQTLFTLAVGTQFGFDVPASPVRPYIGFDLLFSTISGTTRFKGTSNVTSDVKAIDMETATRTGLGFAGGVEIKLLGTALDVSLRYNLINLFSKEYNGSATGTRDEVYKYLNDGEDPNYSAIDVKHPVGDKRTIATIQFQLGVLFGF